MAGQGEAEGAQPHSMGSLSNLNERDVGVHCFHQPAVYAFNKSVVLNLDVGTLEEVERLHSCFSKFHLGQPEQHTDLV